MILRSKAHWGYDAAFMAACQDELTLTPADLRDALGVLRTAGGRFAGMVQVACSEEAELEKLFVDPDHMGGGLGAALLAWGVDQALARGMPRLWITADPGAEGFYLRHGARRVGQEPSGSIPGRTLPRLVIDLRP